MVCVVWFPAGSVDLTRMSSGPSSFGFTTPVKSPFEVGVTGLPLTSILQPASVFPVTVISLPQTTEVWAGLVTVRAGGVLSRIIWLFSSILLPTTSSAQKTKLFTPGFNVISFSKVLKPDCFDSTSPTPEMHWEVSVTV